MGLEDRGRVGSEQGCMSHGLFTPSVGGPISGLVLVAASEVEVDESMKGRFSVERDKRSGLRKKEEENRGGAQAEGGGLANEFLAEDQSVGCGSLKSTDSRHLTRKASVNGLLDSLTIRLPKAEQAGGANLALKGGLGEAFFRRRESAEAADARRFCVSIGCESVSLTDARPLYLFLFLCLSLYCFLLLCV